VGVRVIAALGVAAVIWGWGVAQYPVLLPGTAVTLSNAGAPHATLVAIVVLFVVAVLVVGPSFALLFSLQGRRLLRADDGGAVLASALRCAARRPGRGRRPGRRRCPRPRPRRPPRPLSPSVRRVRAPSTSHCQPSRRAAITRSAIMSIAVSRSRSSQSVPNGRRYRTWYCRAPPMVSCELADPFGHSRPRLTGVSGSPSIWTTLPSLTYTFCPQPTAQYGQADLVTVSASRTRGPAARCARS
jgi:hypothetical protein